MENSLRFILSSAVLFGGRGVFYENRSQSERKYSFKSIKSDVVTTPIHQAVYI